MKYYNKIKFIKLEEISTYFLFQIPSFYRQTKGIYSGESKWTNLGQQLLWNHFAYEYWLVFIWLV